MVALPEPSTIKIKRETWNGKYVTVARDKGRIVTRKKWSGKETTDSVTSKVSLLTVAKEAAPPRRRRAPPAAAVEVEFEEKEYVSKQFDITLQIKTSFGNIWNLIIESRKKHLSKAEVRRIKEGLREKYIPRTDNPIYDEGIKSVTPVMWRDSATGERGSY